MVEKSKEPEAQGEPKVGEVLRTRDYGCFVNTESPAWGRYLVPAQDPLGKRVSWKRIQSFDLKDDFKKIPKSLWARVIALYFHFCDPNNKTVDEKTEVSVLLLREETDFNKWRILVPEQEVGGAYVKAKFDLCCDIETGELIKDNFPPPGWVHAGSSHSHNTMEAFFSSTDDANELSVPGLHVVVGKIDIETGRYQLKASIVLRKQRYSIDPRAVIDMDNLRQFKFHHNVLSVVKKKEPDPVRFGPGGGPWWGRRLKDEDETDRFISDRHRERKNELAAEDIGKPFSLDTVRVKQDLSKLDELLERFNELEEFPEEALEILARHGCLPEIDE